jgi:hypothetical protein
MPRALLRRARAWLTDARRLVACCLPPGPLHRVLDRIERLP